MKWMIFRVQYIFSLRVRWHGLLRGCRDGTILTGGLEFDVSAETWGKGSN